MNMRHETKQDYRAVEELTRKAFWDVDIPGAEAHYIVHTMRDHADFLPELSYVIEVDGKIVANIMYLKTKLVDEEGNEKEVLSFGPISVDPDLQRTGYGKQMMEYTFEKAVEMGYDTVVIFGNPGNYIPRGFKSAVRFNMSLEGGMIPTGMLVKELVPGALDGKKWTFYGSSAHHVDSKEVEVFDKTFEPREKGYKPSQEYFYTYGRSVVLENNPFES